SVMNLFTANDLDLPRELVLQRDGSERFRKYLPRDRTFVNTIEDYPYPYVIGRTCWEFPCVTPSDWSAQHYHKQVASPVTLRDWQAALDCTVIKQGVFCLIFHPYEWSTPQMIVDLIDHATAKHGKKVKFLNFRECLERLNKNMLVGHPIRDAESGEPGIGEIWKWNTGTHVSVLIYKDKEQAGEFRAWGTDSGGRPSWQRFNGPRSVQVTSRKKIKLGHANATVFFRKKTEDEHSILV